jgi:hypothetical protein
MTAWQPIPDLLLDSVQLERSLFLQGFESPLLLVMHAGSPKGHRAIHAVALYRDPCHPKHAISRADPVSLTRSHHAAAGRAAVRIDFQQNDHRCQRFDLVDGWLRAGNQLPGGRACLKVSPYGGRPEVSISRARHRPQV